MQITNGTLVCSEHFVESDFRERTWISKRRYLKPSAVPSVFKWSVNKPGRKPPAERIVPSTSTSEDIGLNTLPNVDLSVSLPDHDYNTMPASVEEQLAAAQTELEICQSEIAKLKSERFGLERFSCDDKLIKFYTGFQSYDTLKTFYQCVSAHTQFMRTWVSVQKNRDSTTSYGSRLHPIDQLFMFLHKLRLGSLDQELADKFNVSQSTVSRNTITWANFLYVVLGSQPLWPSRDQVQKYMPSAFKLYPNTRVIIDCTELAVQSPSSLVLNSELFSQYKSRTTLKCLIGVTPAGATSFVSALYAGSISDKQITKVSGLMDLLEAGDVVMADKGFLIQDLLDAKQCSLVIPHFLSSKEQFTAAEAEENKIIATLRVHVERANRRFEEYHLFDSPGSLNLVGTVNQLWTVACLLANFQGPLIVLNDAVM